MSKRFYTVLFLMFLLIAIGFSLLLGENKLLEQRMTEKILWIFQKKADCEKIGGSFFVLSAPKLGRDLEIDCELPNLEQSYFETYYK